MVMTFNKDKKFTYLVNRTDLPLDQYQPLPDYCPVCKVGITPQFILLYYKDYNVAELLCCCPRNECSSLFFAVYEGNDYSEFDFADLKRLYPYSKQEKDFPEEVTEISPDFVAIYNQAHHAEQEGLDLICGVAYRKALEYLIKDFALKIYPDSESEKIKGIPLQQVIQKYITETSIKNMAERATWLGNDEAHYIRKWENKDLKDLKNLIELTVYFIAMSRKSLKYMGEMIKK